MTRCRPVCVGRWCHGLVETAPPLLRFLFELDDSAFRSKHLRNNFRHKYVQWTGENANQFDLCAQVDEWMSHTL